MGSIKQELDRSGIKVICELNMTSVNQIAQYVANTIYSKFPTLRINYNTLYINVTKIKMFIAQMPVGMSEAAYYYKNSSIYFKQGLKFDEVKRLAVHECIHHFQEIKDYNGKLKRLGICSFLGSKAFGNSINEASVQFMTSYANSETRDVVKYYDIQFPTDSPSYYPLLVNLIKQIGYLVGFTSLFESTFYANDTFFIKFKDAFGENNAFKIQDEFDKLSNLEEKIIKISNKIQQQDMSHGKLNKLNGQIAKLKEEIRKTYFATQNIIYSAYFDARLRMLDTPTKVEQFRRCLCNYSNLIGTNRTYKDFKNYYTNTMVTLNRKYEQLSKSNNTYLVPDSKVSIFAKFFRRISRKGLQANVYEKN